MREADAARVIEERIAAQWSSPPDVYYEEMPRPDGLTEFLSVEIRSGKSTHSHPGQPDYRTVGMVRATVHVLPSTGTRRARELGDSFAALWRAADFTPIALTDAQAGSLRFLASDVGRVEQRDGWFQLVVRTPFVRDVTLS